MHTVSRRAALAGLAFFALWPGPAGAQEQTLKIVFPFAAGGSTDAVARMLADHMQKSLGRAVIVENRRRAPADESGCAPSRKRLRTEQPYSLSQEA